MWVCILLPFITCAIVTHYIYIHTSFTVGLFPVVVCWMLFILIIINVKNERRANLLFKRAVLNSLAIVAVAIAGMGTSVFVRFSFNSIRCNMKQCCNDEIKNNITGLHNVLMNNLYGQPLVINTVVNHLRAHVEGEPDKALVLSFHGLSGTGKTFVATLVAAHLYEDGLQNENVHWMSALYNFPDVHSIDKYKEYLKDKIETAVGKCSQTLFILDEVDKMPEGLLDVIKPYVDFHHSYYDVSYKKAIFIFLSNSGGHEIANATLNIEIKGHSRGTIKLSNIENLIIQHVLNEQGGILSLLTESNLITAYVPFLPLQRTHIIQCIKTQLISKGYHKFEHTILSELVNTIADKISYFPVNVNMYSTTGCKRVSDKIELDMHSDAQ